VFWGTVEMKIFWLAHLSLGKKTEKFRGKKKKSKLTGKKSNLYLKEVTKY
jgi:hypothetical protein